MKPEIFSILSFLFSVASAVLSLTYLARLKAARRIHAERDRALFEMGVVCGALAQSQRPDLDAFEVIPMATAISARARSNVRKG